MDAASVSPRFRLALGVAVSAALLVPLAVYGAPAIAKSASSASHQYRSSCGEYGSSGGQYGSSGDQYGSSGGQYGSSDDEYGSSDDEYGSSGHEYGSSSCRQYRVQICHHTHSWKHPWRAITVSSRSLKAHFRHGDTLSPCAPRPFGKHKHGKGHGHGKHGDDGDRHSNAGTKHDRD